MITVDQIREHLVDMLDSSRNRGFSLRLDDFEDWFSRASWNMHQDSDLRSQEFASSIELLLAEFDSGEMSEELLRKRLESLLDEYSVKMTVRLVDTDRFDAVSGTGGVLSVQEWPLRSFDSQLVMASS